MLSQLKRFVPNTGRVLVQRVKAENKTASGLILPSAADDVKNHALVVRSEDVIYTEGLTVIVPDYGAATITLDGEQFHLYRAEDILGRINAQ